MNCLLFYKINVKRKPCRLSKCSPSKLNNYVKEALMKIIS